MELRVAAVAATSAIIASSTWMYMNAVAKRKADEAKERQNAVLVVDIGSSSVRASVYTWHQNEWKLEAGSMHQHKMKALLPNGNGDVYAIIKAIESVMDSTIAWLTDKTAYRIVGVGFSCFAMSLVGVDANGKPVTPVLTYAGKCPLQTKAIIKSLNEQGLRQEIYNKTGTPIHPSYGAPQLLQYNTSNNPPVQMWQSLVGVILRRWTSASSHIPMSYSEASWTGLFEFREGTWCSKLLELARTSEDAMPPIQDPSIPVGTINSSYLKRWPLLRDAKFYLALADGAAANLGSKCTSSERVGLTIGTSAALRVVCPLNQIKRVPKGLWCYRFSEDLVVLGGALTDGGSLFEWGTQNLLLPPNGMQLLESMQPNSHGLSILPFLNGERAPGWHDNAVCTISGITSSTTSVHILRATLEAVALRLSAIYSLFGDHVSQNAILVASGTGLSSSPTWRQILSDCIGREVWMETNAIELTSRGVAMLIGHYLNISNLDLQPLHSKSVNSKPSLQAHAKYLDARQQQETLYHNVLQA